MKHGRLAWAAVMTAVAVTVLAGFTAAKSTQPAQQWLVTPQVVLAARQMERTVSQTLGARDIAQTADEAPADALLVTARCESGAAGQKFRLYDAQGALIRPVALNQDLECVLRVSPGHFYTLTGENGQSATFYLEANASLSRVSGDGWTDGELLHLEDQTRGSLRIIKTMDSETELYTLAGGDYLESQTLYCPEGARVGETTFTGLLPGVYTLTDSRGGTRTVELTEQTTDVTLGLD